MAFRAHLLEVLGMVVSMAAGALAAEGSASREQAAQGPVPRGSVSGGSAFQGPGPRGLISGESVPGRSDPVGSAFGGPDIGGLAAGGLLSGGSAFARRSRSPQEEQIRQPFFNSQGLLARPPMG